VAADIAGACQHYEMITKSRRFVNLPLLFNRRNRALGPIHNHAILLSQINSAKDSEELLISQMLGKSWRYMVI